MTTIDYFGHEVSCMEHIKEIKEKSSIFNRFYNKKQMLKFYLDEYVFVYGDGEEEYESYKRVLESSGGYTPCGRRVTTGKRDTSVTLVKFETLKNDKSQIEDVLYHIEWWDWFFMKADDGQVYLVQVDED